MIDVETNRGLLTDWDLCKYKAEFHDQAAQPAGRSVCARRTISVLASITNLANRSGNLALPIGTVSPVCQETYRARGRPGIFCLRSLVDGLLLAPSPTQHAEPNRFLECQPDSFGGP